MNKKSIVSSGKQLLINKIKLIKEGDQKVLYSAIVLDDDARSHLINVVKNYVEIPFNWKTIAHHMTIIFNEGLPNNLKEDLGKRVPLTLKKIGISNNAIAVEVGGYPSKNKIPHITIAIPQDGKPFNSNLITDWKPIEDETLIYGKVSEVKPNTLKEGQLKFNSDDTQTLDTKMNRKLLNIVAKKFDLNFRYNDWNNPILDQMRRGGIFNFLDQTMVLDYQKITELCWLIFLNGPIDYLTDPLKTDETFYVYEVGYYSEISEDEVEVDGECGDCDGDGTQNNDCQGCGGSGEYDYGEGEVECEDCVGVGEVETECWNCEGSGVTYFYDDEFHITDNTIIFYSNEPNLDKPKVEETKFEDWYEENSGLLISMTEKWVDTESSFERSELEDTEGTVSIFYPQGDISYDNTIFRTYFRNLIEHRGL